MSYVISAEVSDDLKERIEQAQEEGESRSAAVRRLVRDGLDEDENRVVAFWASFAGVMMYSAAYYAGGNTAAAGVGLAFMLSVFAWSNFPFLKSLANND
jgi:hypothetical protein